MKSRLLTVAAAAGLLFTIDNVKAQVRQPAPTGQVPRAYSGAQSAPVATFKPRPTGQIAPEAPGQLGTIVQPAPAVAPVQKMSEVQDLGFEVNSRPVTQQGSVPKVNTSQDPRTMPERYQQQLIQQQSAAAPGQVQQVQMQQIPSSGTPGVGAPAPGTYAPGTQTSPVPNTTQPTTGQAVPQQGPATTQSATPTQYSAPKAAHQRVDPK
ncbi:MAG: hypothetical protein J7619_09385 [Dyadobacter sp.]|uniref:hypothetical protein n=1 Tax=Dyadobacter sp. TaxID=1914288 RepID=UPI001B0063C6|nr:hypothetical protein [Dyadobacter sp.]MBO9612895.1 hypothetical protein [Dyadobacter sp.]